MNAGKFGGIPRFSLEDRVNLRMVPDLRWGWIRQAGDVVVASAWQTAEFVAGYPRKAGQKVYLVQDYEYYMSGAEDVRQRIANTYRHRMRTVSVAPVISDLVTRLGGGPTETVENGIPLDIYRLVEPIESDERCMIGFPTRAEPFKRTEDAIAAIEIVRREFGDLPVWSFGGERPAYMPNWVEYHNRPSDAELVYLYNRSALFVTPSEYEGWGLPGSEAMACGAALVSADHGGVRAYADHEVTALLSAPRDVNALAHNIRRLLRDPGRRVELATRGRNAMQRFTWERAVEKFEQFLIRAVSDGGRRNSVEAASAK